MTYRALPYEYAIEEGKSGLTALGGLPIYLELAAATGLLKAIDRHLRLVAVFLLGLCAFCSYIF